MARWEVERKGDWMTVQAGRALGASPNGRLYLCPPEDDRWIIRLEDFFRGGHVLDP